MTNLLKLSHLFLASWLFLIYSTVNHAADLTLTPEVPIVQISQQLTLSVSGATGEVIWTVINGNGQIVGSGDQVTYIPDQVGLGIVTVVDKANNNAKMVNITVIATAVVSLKEKAMWEVFTSRSWITALQLSEKRETLWVGTDGGLEKRNAETGEIKRVFMKSSGLPDNWVNALVVDDKGELWVGTDKGLVHFRTDDQLEVLKKDNSGLPSDVIKSLLTDGNGGLWVGTDSGLAHHHENGLWEVFTINNSELPDDVISSLLADDNGGLWVGTEYGLAHYYSDQHWEVITEDNSELLESYWITSICSDHHGGVWVGNDEPELAHYDANGQWEVFTAENSGLPDFAFSIASIFVDDRDGLWVGTEAGGLAYYSPKSSHGRWEVFSTENSQLPGDDVWTLLPDDKGGLWIGTDSGLTRYHANGQWEVFMTNYSGLPGDKVISILAESNDGLWVGTRSGLGHYQANEQNEQWEVFKHDPELAKQKVPQLPDNNVTSLLTDGNSGVWVGTENGLAHYYANDWQKVFTTDNSPLPNHKITSLLTDGNRGIWIGTESGLAHYYSDDHWEVFTKDNSRLLDNGIKSLLADGHGGLWVGTNGGLVRHQTDGLGEVFTKDNSPLPDNRIFSLLPDDKEGLWIGTNNGLAHYHADGQWEVFTKDNSGLPVNEIESLSADGNGGLWIGISEGLVHSANDRWEVATKNNSGLTVNPILSLLADGSGGVWIGTDGGGLAHLTFGQRTCQDLNATDCAGLITGKRAAIIIAGGGAQGDNTLWDTTEATTNHFYNVLQKRGFDKNEIFYLSPKAWADFNGDGFNDRITRAPNPERDLMVDDVRQVFKWAKQIGKLDQPLYIFFIDHGGPEKLNLATNSLLEASELKTLLDDYQTTTGSQVIIILDACYSGSFLQVLAAPNRAVISSAKANELAYFADEKGFSRFFADGILSAMNLWEAFNYARGDELQKIQPQQTGTTSTGTSKLQTPQVDDNGDGQFIEGQDGQWLKQIHVNGNFKTGDITLTVTSHTDSTSIPADQAVTFQAQATLAAGYVKRVWAVVRPPKIKPVLDTNGTPILAYPRINLIQSPNDAIRWATTWNDSIYNGEYKITFYAEDDEGNIASSETSPVITVTGGVEPPPQATVQLGLAKTQYHLGEPIKAILTENLGWGYDLYAAVVLPDGQNFVALTDTNKFAPLNQPKTWWVRRAQNRPLTLLEMTLPENLVTGQYCLYGILSPERENIFKTLEKGLWVSDMRCFEVVQ